MAQKNQVQLRAKAQEVSQFLRQRQSAFAALLPQHMTPEKLQKGVMAAATRNPRILECTTQSILNAVLISASLGLEIGRPRGGAYLVPFRNKKAGGKYEATLIPDYRGLMDLAFRSGRVLSIEARAVYERDVFEFAYGSDSHITHRPALKDRGNLICVYAVAHIRDARPVFYVMSLEEVDEHRARSRAKDDGPWVTDYLAMALKTVVKALVNWLPQSQDDLLERAVELDNRQEAGEGLEDLFDVIEVAAEKVEDRQGGAVDALQSQNQGGGKSDETAKRTRSGKAKDVAPAKPQDSAQRDTGGEGAQQTIPDDDGPPKIPEHHPEHEELMAQNGNFAFAVSDLRDAANNLENEPKGIMAVWGAKIAEWTPNLSAKEVEALRMFKERLFVEADIAGFPQD